MTTLDPFLAGITAGTALGFTGLFRALLYTVAFTAVGYIAWTILDLGTGGIQVAVESMLHGVLAPHARLLAGAALGGLFGDSLQRLPALRR